MIESKHAIKLWENLLIHDDGILGTGGTFCNLIGAFGHGKSTLLMEMAQFVRSLPYGVTKRDLRQRSPDDVCDVEMYPETVLMRGMSDDHWNCLLQRNWAKSFPDYGKSKPVVVHTHCNDNYSFTEVSPGKVRSINHGLNIKKYETPLDLMDNIKIGGINIIYEPSEYFLSEDMRNHLAQYKLQSAEDVKKEGTMAPSPTWWFEFSDTLLQNTEGLHVTLILDEFHDVATNYPTGDMFHITGNFARSMIHFRKNNISMFTSTHDEYLLDYRVKDRIPYRIWFPGSEPKKSMVQIKLLRSLDDVGECVIEEKNIEFGVLNFDRIHNQPPILKAHLSKDKSTAKRKKAGQRKRKEKAL